MNHRGQLLGDGFLVPLLFGMAIIGLTLGIVVATVTNAPPLNVWGNSPSPISSGASSGFYPNGVITPGLRTPDNRPTGWDGTPFVPSVVDSTDGGIPTVPGAGSGSMTGGDSCRTDAQTALVCESDWLACDSKLDAAARAECSAKCEQNPCLYQSLRPLTADELLEREASLRAVGIAEDRLASMVQNAYAVTGPVADYSMTAVGSKAVVDGEERFSIDRDAYFIITRGLEGFYGIDRDETPTLSVRVRSSDGLTDRQVQVEPFGASSGGISAAVLMDASMPAHGTLTASFGAPLSDTLTFAFDVDDSGLSSPQPSPSPLASAVAGTGGTGGGTFVNPVPTVEPPQPFCTCQKLEIKDGGEVRTKKKFGHKFWAIATLVPGSKPKLCEEGQEVQSTISIQPYSGNAITGKLNGHDTQNGENYYTGDGKYAYGSDEYVADGYTKPGKTDADDGSAAKEYDENANIIKWHDQPGMPGDILDNDKEKKIKSITANFGFKGHVLPEIIPNACQRKWEVTMTLSREGGSTSKLVVIS